MQNKKFEFFFGKQSYLSQFYPCSFLEDEIKFNCAEQYMMYRKALLFKDQTIANQILKTNNPVQLKKLGRMVQGFEETTWTKNREEIVYQGNWLKFSQNPKLKEHLLSTNHKILVEASPYDKIWGIGFDCDKALANQHRWGLNLLGKILMQVRDKLTVKL